ncbi:MAG: Hpt domain-containing protein, partial [Oligoflexales bacterium]|nr:Hpt domain-containing protein [Oligoflexales bacterium]
MIERFSFYRQTTGYNLLKVFFPIYLLVSIILVLGQIIFEYNYEREKVFSDLSRYAKSFSPAFATALWEYNTGNAEYYADGILKIDIIQGVRIVEKTQNKLFMERFSESGEIKLKKEDIPLVDLSDRKEGLIWNASPTEKANNSIRINIKETSEYSIDRITLNINDLFHYVYEYRFPIFSNARDVNETSLLGWCLLYSSEQLIINRIKVGFMLSVLNVVIVALILFMIFILAVKYIVERPLKDLAGTVKSVDLAGLKAGARFDETFEHIKLRHDEIGLLGNCFQNMVSAMARDVETINRLNEDLNNLNNLLKDHIQKVEQTVKERTQTIHTILDNIKTGFLPVDSDGLIKNGFTNSCHSLFGKTIREGDSLGSVLAMNSQQEEIFLLSLKQVFEDQLPEEVTLKQIGFKHILESGKVISFEGVLMRDDLGRPQALLFTITDITRLTEVEMVVKQNESIIRILNHIESFNNYLTITGQQIAEIKNSIQKGDEDKARMLLHAIKGNSDVFGLIKLSKSVHEIEDQKTLNVEDLDRLEYELQKFLRENKKTIGPSLGSSKNELQTIRRSDVINLQRRIARSKRPEDIQAIVNDLIILVTYRPISVLLGPISEIVQTIAKDLMKKVVFNVTGD